MKSFLDNLGVKRLTQNIRDWAESKFVDSDNYEYDPLEIDYLVTNGKLKTGKIYKINYSTDFERISFASSYAGEPYRGNTVCLLLKAVDNYAFYEDAYYKNTYGYMPIKFKYRSCDKIIQISNDIFRTCEIRSTKATYLFKNFINNNNSAVFYKMNGLSESPEQIIITKYDINNNNIVEIDDVVYTIYYDGLGTVTWMKDHKGNETNFNNYILKDSKQPVQGSNNIVKSNIDFGSINGNNNTVGINCKNVNIGASNNYVNLGCSYIDIDSDNNIIINSQNLNIEENNLIYVNNTKY